MDAGHRLHQCSGVCEAAGSATRDCCVLPWLRLCCIWPQGEDDCSVTTIVDVGLMMMIREANFYFL